MMEWKPIETAPRDGTIIIVQGGTVEYRIDGWFSHVSQSFLQWEPKEWCHFPEKSEVEE